MAFGGQPGREPGEKEHQHGIAGKLTDAGADDLAFAQQLADQRPAERHLLVRRGAQAAAVFDMLTLLLAETRIFMRFAVAAPPHQGKQNANRADADEQHPPAEAIHDPEQQRGKAGQPKILPHGVNRRGLRALLLREPGADHPAIDRKARRFADAKPETAQQQRFQPHRHAVEQGKQRPQGQRQKIGDFVAKAVKKQPAGDLRQGVGPGESGEKYPHDRWIDPQLSGELWGGDPQHGAVEVVDHGADGQQRKNADAPPGAARGDGRLGGSRRVRAI